MNSLLGVLRGELERFFVPGLLGLRGGQCPLGDLDLPRHLGLQPLERRLRRGQLRLGDAEFRLEQRHLLAVRHGVDLSQQLAGGDHVLFLNQVADEVAGDLLRGDVDDVGFDEGVVRDRMGEPIDHPVPGKRRHHQQDQAGHHCEAQPAIAPDPPNELRPIRSGPRWAGIRRGLRIVLTHVMKVRQCQWTAASPPVSF